MTVSISGAVPLSQLCTFIHDAKLRGEKILDVTPAKVQRTRVTEYLVITQTK